MKIKKGISVSSVLIFSVLLLYSVSLIVTISWGVMASFKFSWDFEDFPVNFPKPWMWRNYLDAFSSFYAEIDGGRKVLMGEMYLNTILYAVGCAFMVTVTPCLTAYVVARFKFKFLKIYYFVVIVCMALPIVGSLPSELQIAKDLGLYNHIYGMWLMKGYFLGMYFLVFYASFKAMPMSFTEAAQIDGASHFDILISVALPLIKNVFFTVMLIKTIEYWNDYQVALIFMPDKPTLAAGLYTFAFSGTSEPPMQLTGSMLLFIPIFIVFIIFHEKLMGNVSMGGIKE